MFYYFTAVKKLTVLTENKTKKTENSNKKENVLQNVVTEESLDIYYKKAFKDNAQQSV